MKGEAATEARGGLANALGDSAYETPLAGQDRDDAVGLTELCTRSTMPASR